MTGLFAAAQNTVTIRRFPWKTEKIPYFGIYFYGQGGRDLLPFVNTYMERAFARSKNVLPFSPSQRFPILIYNTHNEFEQTNITSIGEGTGGVTEAFKNRLVVGNVGSQRYLEYVLAHEFTHEVEYEYLFSAFWRTPLLLKFVIYPSWLMEGLSEYTSGDLDYVTREMYLRDAATSGGLLSLHSLLAFNHVLPHQVTLAYKESEALMHYLSREYGEKTLADMLEAWRYAYSSDSVLQAIYGIDLSMLDKKFRDSLVEDYRAISRAMQEPSVYGPRLTEDGPYPSFFTGPVVTPDGKHLVYLSDQRGQTEPYMMDLASRTVRRLWDMSRSPRIEDIHDEGFPLSVSPDGKLLVFVGESVQRDYLYLYCFDTTMMTRIDTGLDTLASPVFSRDGKHIYFSGIRHAFRDLYVWDLEGSKLKQLTFTPMDEVDVQPSPDGVYIYYSAERKNPLGRTEYDLCRSKAAGEDPEFITELPGDERFPSLSSDGTMLYFTSNRDGVNDLYRIPAGGGTPERLTNVVGGIFYPRTAPNGRDIYFSSFRRTRMHIYRHSLEEQRPAPETASVLFSSATPQLSVPASTPTAVVPYRFRASTDLFLPVLFYSSSDGLYLSALWQFSEFMGNHVLYTVGTLATGADYYNYQVSYGFLKYRPKIYVTAVGQQYFDDVDMTDQLREDAKTLLINYPLDRFQLVGVGAGTVDHREHFEGMSQLDTKRQENVGLFEYLYDTSYAKYLETTTGIRLGLMSQISGPLMGGDYRYREYTAELQNYFPLPRESTIAWRLFGATSSGADRSLFRLGGPDRVRGVPQDDIVAGNSIVVTSLAYRFPLNYNINYDTWYILPDFYFKSLYGGVFADAGATRSNGATFEQLTLSDWSSSVGVELRLYTFILQRAPILLDLQLVRRLDQPTWSFYLTTGYTLFFNYPFKTTRVR